MKHCVVINCIKYISKQQLETKKSMTRMFKGFMNATQEYKHMEMLVNLHMKK